MRRLGSRLGGGSRVRDGFVSYMKSRGVSERYLRDFSSPRDVAAEGLWASPRDILFCHVTYGFV